MLRDGLDAAYTWRVRHFKAGEARETLFRFRPDGVPDGFTGQFDETAPGAALRRGRSIWRRTSWSSPRKNRCRAGAPTTPFIYERATPTLGEGRYRLSLVVSGDRLTEVRRFVQIPEAFSRRYQEMWWSNDAIGIGASVTMLLRNVVGGRSTRNNGDNYQRRH